MKGRRMSTQGIHLIWSTYGSWLPGDARGHWSPLFDIYGRLRKRGHQLNMPDAVTRSQAESRLIDEPKRLNETEEIIVGCAIVSFAQAAWEAAGWPGPLDIQSLAVEPEHIHLLLGPISVDVGEIVGRIKSATSSLLCQLPAVAGRQRTWSSGYWKVFLFDHEAVDVVRGYIEDHNVRRGFPRDRLGCSSETI
jgi:REP element-mobilizing transposase RayT